MPPKPKTENEDTKPALATKASKPSPSTSKEAAGTQSQGNKLSKQEKELFMKCVQADQRTLSHEELQAAMPDLDIVEKMGIANSLIARGMLQIRKLQDELFYTAVDKSQQKVNSNMSQDEKLVYDNIVSSGNTGIWTKTLKMRTNIHQSNITKCLKSLEGKNLIKAVKSVKFPTRKIYMLAELQPSIELSGGPWYTDNELDTEFIGVLLRSIYKCLQDRSYPPQPNPDSCRTLLYPASHTPYLPTTVHDVLAYLKQSQIIQEGTDLTTEHILTLLDVLMYDGVVERITVGTAKCEGQDDLSEPEFDLDEDSDDDNENHYNSSNSLKRRKNLSSGPASKKQKMGSVKKLRFQGGSDDLGSDAMQEEDVKPQRKSGPKRVLPHNEAFVYRALRPAQNQPEYDGLEIPARGEDWIPDPPNISGFFDMPCGHCPSFDFCSTKGKAWQFKGNTTLGADHGSHQRRLPRLGLAGIGAGFSAVGGLGAAGGVAPVNPGDCVYFTDWLEF